MKKLLLLFYFVFCLLAKSYSQNIPPFNVSSLDTSRSVGYYLLSAFRFSGPTAVYPLRMILDKNGHVVYVKKIQNGSGTDYKLSPNDLFSYHRGTKFYFEDSFFRIVDSVTTKNGIVLDGHDIQVLPNGHFLLLGSETVTMNLSSYNMFNQNGSPGSPSATVKCGVIQELDTNRNVVFEWHSRNYFLFDDVDEEYLGSPTYVDWTHFNAVELDADGNILVSSRHFNEITKISRNDSTVMWRLGGKRNQFTFTNDPLMFKGQHDIRRIGNGHITLYDNGEMSVPVHPATAKEYQLDETTLTATLDWSYVENPNSFSAATGNVQRLPGNNTLVNYGNLRNANVVFNVVDSIGNKIFELSFPDTVASYRASNYSSLPWSLPRPVITCDSIAGQYFLDAGAGHASYLWSNGATTRTIAVTAPGTFFVYVPVGVGGYISSELYVAANVSSPCAPVGLAEIEKSMFQLFPNPVKNELHIVLNATQEREINIGIFDMAGRAIVFETKKFTSSEYIVDVSKLAGGIYFLEVGHTRKRFVKNQD